MGGRGEVGVEDGTNSSTSVSSRTAPGSATSVVSNACTTVALVVIVSGNGYRRGGEGKGKGWGGWGRG